MAVRFIRMVLSRLFTIVLDGRIANIISNSNPDQILKIKGIIVNHLRNLCLIVLRALLPFFNKVETTGIIRSREIIQINKTVNSKNG
jgi:uncharacterized membrane protein